LGALLLRETASLHAAPKRLFKSAKGSVAAIALPQAVIAMSAYWRDSEGFLSRHPKYEQRALNWRKKSGPGI